MNYTADKDILGFKNAVLATIGCVENIFEVLSYDQKSITELENFLIKNINRLVLTINDDNQFYLLVLIFNRPHIIIGHLPNLNGVSKFELQKFIVEKIEEDLNQIQNEARPFNRSKCNKEKILNAIALESQKVKESYSEKFIESVELLSINNNSLQKYHKDENIEIYQKTIELKITIQASSEDNNKLRLFDLHKAFNTRGEQIKQIGQNEYLIWFAHYRINEIENDNIRNGLYDFMEETCNIHQKELENLGENFVEKNYNEFYKEIKKFYLNNVDIFDKYIKENPIKINGCNYKDTQDLFLFYGDKKPVTPQFLIDLIDKAGLERLEFVNKYLDKMEQSNLKSEFIKTMDIVYGNNLDCQLNNERYTEQEENTKENNAIEQPSRLVSLVGYFKNFADEVGVIK